MLQWDYLVAELYEQLDFIPPSCPPGRLMTEKERVESYQLFAGGKKATTDMNLTKFLKVRGQQGWELVHVERLSTGNEYEPGYWKCFFKQPRN